MPTMSLRIQTAVGTPTLQVAFAGHDVVEGFAATDEAGTVAFDQHFRSAASRVVLTAHHRAIRTRREDREQIALFHRRDKPVAAKVVAAFTNGPDDVHRSRSFDAICRRSVGRCNTAGRGDWPNEMVGVIERRSDQVGHRSVDDDELLGSRFLQVHHPRDQDACIG